MNAPLLPPTPGRLQPPRREWRKAAGALRRLLADKDDTAQVFEIMRALNGKATRRGYARMLSSFEGGRIAYQRVELAPLLADRAWLASLGPGTLAAAYLDFTAAGRISPEGLVDVSRQVMVDIEHPVAWFGRRIRDSHDLWHVLTGYGLDALGEACLVAFSYAQTGALGWAVIATGAALNSRRHGHRGMPYARAIWEGYRRGRAARWLSGEDYIALLGERLEAVRARLGLALPAIYDSIPPARRGIVPGRG